MKTSNLVILSAGIGLLLALSSCGLAINAGIAAANATGAAVKNKKQSKNYDPQLAQSLKIDIGELENLTFLSQRKLTLTLGLLDEKKGERLYVVGEKEYLTLADFDLSISGAVLDENNNLTIDQSINNCKNGMLRIEAVYKHKPEVRTVLEHNLFSLKSPAFTFGGGNGSDGSSGFKGKEAQPNSGSEGSPCREGEDGKHGSHGNPGLDGKNLTVYMKRITTSALDHEVIALKMSVDGKESIAYFDPKQQETLRLIVSGGHGGDGGNGGKGGRGTYKVSGCNGGRGGDGGDGGDGGQGGNITVYADPNINLQEINLNLLSEGGKGGNAGSAGDGGVRSGQSESTRYSSGKNGKAGRAGSKGVTTIVREEVSTSIFGL